MDRTNKILLLVAQLLDKWDELPNDVKSEPELEDIKNVIDHISEIEDEENDENL